MANGQQQGQQAQGQNLLPFRQGSRQRKRRSKMTIPFSQGFGDIANFELAKVGMINYLVWFIRGTFTFSSVGSFTGTEGPWSLLKRLRVDLNLSNMNLFDLDGPMCFRMASQMFRGWTPAGTPNDSIASNPLAYSAPMLAGDNEWIIPYFIPISANPGDSFDTALINAQAPEVQVLCEARVEPNPANIAQNLTAVTNLRIDPFQCYFSSLDPRAVILPLGQVVRTIQFSQAVVNTGENILTLPRQGKIMNTLTRFLANGQLSDLVDRVEIVANINDTMYAEDGMFNAFEYQRDYSHPKPVGVFYNDFWHARESPSSGDGRDLVNLEVLTTFQQKIFVSESATLGTTGNNWLHHGRRILVNFQSPATSGINPLSQG